MEGISANLLGGEISLVSDIRLFGWPFSVFVSSECREVDLNN